MKKQLKVAGLVVALAMVFVGGAIATPLPSIDTFVPDPENWSWRNDVYWTFTDFTTNIEGNSGFELYFEKAAYDSDFGLYTLDDSGAVASKLEVFDYLDEPSSGIQDNPTRSVSFFYEDSTWKAFVPTLGQVRDDAIEFGSIFGFYFDVHKGGANDPNVDYTMHSDKELNLDEKLGVAVLYNGLDKTAKILLDDQLASSSDWDYNDMAVSASDIAPVPEPATILLFGAGLLGLAAYGRKKGFRRS